MSKHKMGWGHRQGKAMAAEMNGEAKMARGGKVGMPHIGARIGATAMPKMMKAQKVRAATPAPAPPQGIAAAVMPNPAPQQRLKGLAKGGAVRKADGGAIRATLNTMARGKPEEDPDEAGNNYAAIEPSDDEDSIKVTARQEIPVVAKKATQRLRKKVNYDKMSSDDAIAAWNKKHNKDYVGDSYKASGYAKGGAVHKNEVKDAKAKGGPIHIKPENKGKLHAKMGVPAGKKIPMKALEKAKSTGSPATKRQAQFAINAKSFKHAKGGAISKGKC